MTDEPEMGKEKAKAVQEAAKLGTAIVEAGSALGGRLSRMLGTVPDDLVGLTFGDYLHELRKRNLDKITRRTEEILKARNVENPKTIAAKVAIPAFEAASMEEDGSLQELWARLLANAMDPNCDVTLDKVLIDALKGFEPLDAIVFREHAGMTANNQQNILGVASQLPYRQSQILVSAERIERLGCFSRTNLTPPVYKLSALGQELWHAINDDTDK